MLSIERLAKWPAAFLLLAILFLTACSKEPQIVSLGGPTMGTTYSVKWVDTDLKRAESLHPLIDAKLVEINQQMSTYIKDSELSSFNQSPAGTEVKASDQLFEVLSLAHAISDETDGAFDITVGPLVNLWGFGPEGRIIKAPDNDEIVTLRERIGYQKLKLADSRLIRKEADIYVDLSAIAKGYAVDQLAKLLEQNGIEQYLVEIGGELRAKGEKPGQQPWRIAIESPQAGERGVQRIVQVRDVGIATSGDYRNYFEQDGVRYSHTIDPATAKPISHNLASVTVLSPQCAKADAYATAYSVMGPEAAYEHAIKHNVAAFFLIKSGNAFIEKMTPAFEPFLQQ